MVLEMQWVGLKERPNLILYNEYENEIDFKILNSISMFGCF